MEEGTQEALVLIVLLEELLTESTFLGSQVEKLLVVKLTVEPFCQLPGDDPATGTYLPANVNDYLLVLHVESVVLHIRFSDKPYHRHPCHHCRNEIRRRQRIPNTVNTKKQR